MGKGKDRNLKDLYVQMFSIHGLVRGEALELGRDADTGGQVKYVLELARALGRRPEVERVELVTRLISDKAVSKDYAQPVEPLSPEARIVRIQCGGRKYVRKELLWPHLDEMVDKTVKYLKKQGRIPDVFHGHYADGGYVARELAAFFGVPFVFTGHSMGAHKKGKLMADGLSEEEVNRRYHIDQRIRVEERIIRDAEQIVVSTRHEIERQYSLYENFAAGHFNVVPPGIDIDTFYPYYQNQFEHNVDEELARQTRVVLLAELERFWGSTHKPFILALCRPDQRKNISGLIKAYGEDKDLQAIANLAIFAGIRKDIASMEENERHVLTEMLLLMDNYDLYGKLAIPKKHDFTLEVPELYRLCADSRGVFVNPALVEPFGLTLVEAASCGVPIVATEDGGPADIIANCDNGILVDPTDSGRIAAACKAILVDRELWDKYSRNGIIGVRNHYSWESHCASTIEVYARAQAAVPKPDPATEQKPRAIGKRLAGVDRLLITDIDNTLVGDEEAMRELLELLDKHRDQVAWGVATGRSLEVTLDVLAKHRIPVPDIIIAAVGTEIYYGPDFGRDNGWQQHLRYQWKPAAIRKALAGLVFLKLQEDSDQHPFKVSYFMDDAEDNLARVHFALQERKLHYTLEFSHGSFLDILPYRAGKGKALRYLSYKWNIPLNRIMICGDSGSDAQMLRGDTCGVVVGNYSRELEPLRGQRKLFFSKQEYAAGIMDGIRHYKFLNSGSRQVTKD
ncbi:HAD-IIB family hydrolase [Desulfurivibrio alkaliphilus]|uniref:sucrose-phosphate synthase n=1 Tax=Desulfurivibrio alkaliphilus (strain DSM 19089 / UNIQEM U267 / AHT2) TaxID=589865 RepID=D6Z3A7_DESAT|nr:HAD-IIB family hydrolase [Desulfurivibrio alkaliphilus]ADH86032.1 sucrose-phosphate synthase [Desulfurivibrio alkaliphilus AHT 2]